MHRDWLSEATGMVFIPGVPSLPLGDFGSAADAACHAILALVEITE
jgi:hypothetical protein